MVLVRGVSEEGVAVGLVYAIFDEGRARRRLEDHTAVDRMSLSGSTPAKLDAALTA